MKYNKSQIMKRAWEIKRQDERNIFGECLKMAWDEAKKQSTKKTGVDIFIGKLVDAGANRWQKYGYDRLYISGCESVFDVKIENDLEMMELFGSGYINMKNMKFYCKNADSNYIEWMNDMILEKIA